MSYATRDPTFVGRGEAGEVGSKKDLINTARLIAKESEEVVKMARKVAEACTDKRMKRVSEGRSEYGSVPALSCKERHLVSLASFC